ncbi:MAG: hypothetical protein ACK4WD_13770 [Flavobacteriales bacterium]|jgi:hypothetical protein
MKKRWTKRIVILSIVLSLGYIAFRMRYEISEYVLAMFGSEIPVNPRPENMSTVEWAELNYSDEMKKLSKKHDVPYEYLMALVILECGGDKPAGHRYEPSIMKRLKRVKDGKVDRLENIYQHHLQNCDDGCLENLATSWGPFQLMGYKAIPLGVSVTDLRHEDDAAEVGVEWIAQEYGHFLKKKKYKDAFHYHNTGQRFPLSGRPKTHSPYYVSDGLKYMKIFEKRKNQNPS